MDETPLKRAQACPLHRPAEIYAVLSGLSVGDPVPPQVFIADYQDGTIPPWLVCEIEEHAPGCRVLTVCDKSAVRQATLFEPEVCVGRDIITLPTKTLAGPFYGWHPGGCGHRRNPLADIQQHARQIVDRAGKLEVSAGVSRLT